VVIINKQATALCPQSQESCPCVEIDPFTAGLHWMAVHWHAC